MPPSGKLVLLKQQEVPHDPFVVIGKWIAKFTEESDEDFHEHSDYCEETDERYLPEGFYERIANWDEFRFLMCEGFSPVIEWMEIPK